MLQVRVLEYRHVSAGVEVDVRLSAISRTGRSVWESVLTLLSPNKLHKASRCLPWEESQSKCSDKNVFFKAFILCGHMLTSSGAVT